MSLEATLSQSQRSHRLARASGLAETSARNHLVPGASCRNRQLLLGRIEPDDVEYCEQVIENSSFTNMQPLHQHR